MNNEALIELVCDALWTFCPSACSSCGCKIDISRSITLEEIRAWVEKRMGEHPIRGEDSRSIFDYD